MVDYLNEQYIHACVFFFPGMCIMSLTLGSTQTVLCVQDVARHHLKGQNHHNLMACLLSYPLQVLVNGGACQNLLQWLRLRKEDEVADSLPLATSSAEMIGLQGPSDDEQDKRRRERAGANGTAGSSDTGVTVILQQVAGHTQSHHQTNGHTSDRLPALQTHSSMPLLQQTAELSAQAPDQPDNALLGMLQPQGRGRGGGDVRSRVHAPGLAGWEEEEEGDEQRSTQASTTAAFQQMLAPSLGQSLKEAAPGLLQQPAASSTETFCTLPGTEPSLDQAGADGLQPPGGASHPNGIASQQASDTAENGTQPLGYAQNIHLASGLSDSRPNMQAVAQASPATAAAVAAAVAGAAGAGQGQPPTLLPGSFMIAPVGTSAPAPPVQGSVLHGALALTPASPQQQQGHSLDASGNSGQAAEGYTSPESAQQQQDVGGPPGDAANTSARGRSAWRDVGTQSVDRRAIQSKYVPKVGLCMARPTFLCHLAEVECSFGMVGHVRFSDRTQVLWRDQQSRGVAAGSWSTLFPGLTCGSAMTCHDMTPLRHATAIKRSAFRLMLTHVYATCTMRSFFVYRCCIQS
jgi:hypothetical protein